MAYTIRILPRATADFTNAVTWRRQQSPQRAARLHAGLLARVRTLTVNPERCPLAEEAEDLGLDLRELLYGRRRNVYRVLFVIDGTTVNVLRVRHAAQDRLTASDLF